jgi:hypothetical protein
LKPAALDTDITDVNAGGKKNGKMKTPKPVTTQTALGNIQAPCDLVMPSL